MKPVHLRLILTLIKPTFTLWPSPQFFFSGPLLRNYKWQLLHNFWTLTWYGNCALLDPFDHWPWHCDLHLKNLVWPIAQLGSKLSLIFWSMSLILWASHWQICLGYCSETVVYGNCIIFSGHIVILTFWPLFLKLWYLTLKLPSRRVFSVNVIF